MDSILAEEKRAFDEQILERVANGHIPDIRRAPVCEYFYNNSWRHPDFVALDFGEQFELIKSLIDTHVKASGPVRVLEVGCGPGYMSLELSRAGFTTLGMDLSSACIDVAKKTAAEDPWIATRAPLHYVSGDFFSHPELGLHQFDVVIFLGALHHFPDQAGVALRVKELLTPSGIVIAHEPTRDRVGKNNAAVALLIQTLLSASGNYFKSLDLSQDHSEIKNTVEKLYLDLLYEGEGGDKLQSVNDNEAGYAEMHATLTQYFSQLHLADRYGFFHEIIGGLRFDHEKNKSVARFIREADKLFCELGIVNPTEFVFVGRNQS